MLKGIDVSSWQNIDFNNLDTDFIIMKSSEGVGFTDPKFYNFQKQARDKDMLVGYYHFCRPDLGNTSEAEAEYFVSVCKPSDGEMLVLDFEVSYSSKVSWCKRWLDRVCELTGCKPLIYLNKSLVSGNDWSTVIDAGYGLWLADYSYDPNSDCPSTPWPFVAIRQYSNREVVPGLSGPVDGNVFYGDKEAFLKYGVNSQLEPENSELKFGYIDNFSSFVDDNSHDISSNIIFGISEISTLTSVTSPNLKFIGVAIFQSEKVAGTGLTKSPINLEPLFHEVGTNYKFGNGSYSAAGNTWESSFENILGGTTLITTVFLIPYISYIQTTTLLAKSFHIANYSTIKWYVQWVFTAKMLEEKILAMDKLIDELRESRDKWKKNYKDLEEIYVRTKTELETATLKIGILESAVQQNKTPLSYYTWKERFLSLFKEVK